MKNRGFTLTELLIVLAIVGILFAVALPSYQNSVLRANRTVGKTTIDTIMQRQESYFADNKRYADTLTKLGYGSASINVDANGTSAGAAIYTVTLQALPNGSGSNVAQCNLGSTGAPYTIGYAVVATGTGVQTKDKDCQTLCSSSSGKRGSKGANSTPGAGASRCWAN
jgi:type IV pilus assembly protein PilE